MTITITTGNTGYTDFLAYLDAFGADYTSAGRGGFSNGLSGDYASSEGEIGEIGIVADQGYIARGSLSYNLATHVVGGTISSIEFGHGATGQDEGNGATRYAFSLVDYTVDFTPDLDEGEAQDVLYGLFEAGAPGQGSTDPLVDLLETGSVIFRGGAGEDVFGGYRRPDVLNGRRGDDILKGRAGSDKLAGGAGSDKLFGNWGADDLTGGAGRDILVGGRGADNFHFTKSFGRDIIRDFQAGVDDLDFSGAIGEVRTVASFKAASSEVNGRVIYDMDNDGANVVVLIGVSLDDLHARDFIF